MPESLRSNCSSCKAILPLTSIDSLFLQRMDLLAMDTLGGIVQALTPLVEVFEELQVSYYIGGSVASSAYGEARQTLDADIVADIQYEHVRPLVRRLEAL